MLTINVKCQSSILEIEVKAEIEVKVIKIIF